MFNFMRLPPLRRLMLMKAITGGGSWSTISGNPVSFTARNAPLRQLSVAFSPKQDLHGYDSPWPAGGGKNKCPDKKYQSNESSVYVGQDNGTDFPLSLADTTYTLSFTLVRQMGIKVYLREEHATVGTEIYSGSTENAVIAVSPSVAGKYRLAIFRQDGISVSDISNVQLELGSSATSYAPYSNECPISGWDSLTVEQRGKNLFDGTYENWIVTTADGITFYPAADANARTAVFPIKGGQKYTVSRSGGNRFSIYESVEYPQTGAAHPVKTLFSNSTSTEATVTTSANARYLLVYVTNAVSTAPVTSLQCEIGETATPYVPYTGRSISINLGSTVYSGTVDVVTGVGEVDKAKITKKWSEFANKDVGETYAEGRVYLSNFDSSKRTSSICDCLKYSNDGADYGKCFYVPSSGDYFRAIVMNTVSDDDEFTFVYPLATPLTIQLTPQEVQSLAGDNTLWSDANQPLTVTYRSN